jgi:hypothetical protein
LAVVSVAGVPLEARRVYGQFQGPEAEGPPPPGALTAPWWQVKLPLAPGGLRGTALGPPFHSARVQRGTTLQRKQGAALPPPRQRPARRGASRVWPPKWGVLGPCFTPKPTPCQPRRLKQIDPPPVPSGKILLYPGTINQMHPPGSHTACSFRLWLARAYLAQKTHFLYQKASGVGYKAALCARARALFGKRRRPTANAGNNSKSVKI